MNQVFPALPRADKIAVLALCEVLPVVHSDVIKVVQTNGEFFQGLKSSSVLNHEISLLERSKRNGQLGLNS